MKVPLTVSDFLRRGALVYPDRPALIDEPGTAGSLGTITYRSLERRARGLAIALDEMGVGQRERVAIVSPNAARFGIAFYGISGFGRVLVPVNYRLNADEVSYVVEHSGSSVLLVDPESDEALRDVKAKHRIVLDGVDDERLFAEAPDDAEPAGWEPDGTRRPINHGGTTARPKELTRNCWLNAAVQRLRWPRCRCSTATAENVRGDCDGHARSSCARSRARNCCGGSTRTASR
jgi:acyl-CoA synthetase (AMP-forming)/AMP-acid ligase II